MDREVCMSWKFVENVSGCVLSKDVDLLDYHYILSINNV
jgi:hypothetical protein